MSNKKTWKKLKDTSVKSFEKWIEEMDYEPYIYDPELQSVDWVKDLTEAIKKVGSVIGDGKEESIVLGHLYWDQLSSWEFILNCFSIVRAMDGITIIGKKFNWQTTFDQFRLWVESSLSHSDTRELYLSGTHFFYDMHQFFSNDRKLSDPKKLAKEVLKKIQNKENKVSEQLSKKPISQDDILREAKKIIKNRKSLFDRLKDA